MTDKPKTKPRTKARKLTEAEIFYIQEKSKTMPIEDIAAAIKAPVRFIEDVYQAAVEKAVEESKTDKDPHIMKLMNRNKEYGVVTMTQAASEVGDEQRRSKKEKTKKAPSHIHRI